MAESYFQFPLCALAFGENEDLRLNAILAYGLVHAGTRLYAKLTYIHQQAFMRTLIRKKRYRGDGSPDWELCAAFYGADALGVTCTDIDWLLARHEKMQSFIDEFEKKHGKDARVRIKKNWLFKARDGNGLSYREFSLLCGLYSVIGDKEMVIASRNRMRRCALGYRTEAIMQAELPMRADKALPLTERRLRDAMTRLHENRFFARSTVGRRKTYYSIRLSGEDLRKSILERRTYRPFFHAHQKNQDDLLTANINRLKAQCLAGSAANSLRS